MIIGYGSDQENSSEISYRRWKLSVIECWQSILEDSQTLRQSLAALIIQNLEQEASNERHI